MAKQAKPQDRNKSRKDDTQILVTLSHSSARAP